SNTFNTFIILQQNKSNLALHKEQFYISSLFQSFFVSMIKNEPRNKNHKSKDKVGISYQSNIIGFYFLNKIPYHSNWTTFIYYKLYMLSYQNYQNNMYTLISLHNLFL